MTRQQVTATNRRQVREMNAAASRQQGIANSGDKYQKCHSREAACRAPPAAADAATAPTPSTYRPHASAARCLMRRIFIQVSPHRQPNNVTAQFTIDYLRSSFSRTASTISPSREYSRFVSNAGYLFNGTSHRAARVTNMVPRYVTYRGRTVTDLLLRLLRGSPSGVTPGNAGNA